MMRRLCKKCLLSEMDPDKELQSILDYIREIPSDKRTDDETYRKRLDICRGCEKLANGICAVCGCYVELRAAKKVMYCPSENKYW